MGATIPSSRVKDGLCGTLVSECLELFMYLLHRTRVLRRLRRTSRTLREQV